MSYFPTHYKDISFPDSEDGLRNAQLGAIHAVGAHFSLHSKEPALITGTGKTAVYNGCISTKGKKGFSIKFEHIGKRSNIK